MSVLSLNLENIQTTALPGFKFTGSLTDIIKDLLPYVFSLAGIILLLYFIIGGVGLMFSQGDPKATQAARGKITNAVAGFAIIFLAYWLTQLLGEVLNIQIIKDIFQ